MKEVEEESLMIPESDVPDHFLDEDIMNIKTNEILTTVEKQYPPTLGLLLKLRRAGRHACQRAKMNVGNGHSQTPLFDSPDLLWQLWNSFTSSGSIDSGKWTAELLFSLSDEIRLKSRYISGRLVAALSYHSLIPTTIENGIIFDPHFLRRVKEYHDGLERPDGTFETSESESESALEQAVMERRLRLDELSHLPRDICSGCSCRKQVYCGDCIGLRMRNAEDVLPKRISLPFDVVLLIDWHETLHKCTGVHAGALCAEGTVSVQRWKRTDRPNDLNDLQQVRESGWASVAQTFDYRRDIILFPSESSLDIMDVLNVNPQNEKDEILPEGVLDLNEKVENIKISDDESKCSSPPPLHYRLILIESTWGGAKTIVNQLQYVRSVIGLPPLQCVKLPVSVKGLYWKLQHVGTSAVSTIEALAHAAAASGCPATDVEKLLTLFYLQRLRLINRVKTDGCPPIAVDVRGPWKLSYT